MSEQHSPGGSSPSHAPGIFQSCVAAAIGAACAPLFTFCWKHYPGGDPPAWALGAVPSLAGGVVVLGLWYGSHLLLRRRWRRRAECPKGDRIAVYVADLHGDNGTQSARASVIDSILREIGSETVEVLPAGFELTPTDGVSSDRSAGAANAEARKFLSRKGGDLLIWGRVHTIGQQNVLELRFVGAESGGAAAPRFGFNQELLLEEKFAPEMGATLAALAASLALPALSQRGTAIGKRLLPLVDRLGRIVHKSGLKLQSDDRAGLLFSYAAVLYAVGEQLGDSAKLEEAVTAYREALEERTRERVPLDWAMTQNNLGNALRTLGERESGTARLEEAVAAYRAALEEWTRERVPLDWATTQNNLGNALRTLGERESGTARLEEAVDGLSRGAGGTDARAGAARLGDDAEQPRQRACDAGRARERDGAAGGGGAAYRAALEEWTRERVPLDWATTQNNLGNALSTLGERESGTARLEEAVAAYRAALEEWTRERVPLDWAMTQNNLGNALRTLGERESGTARLEEAVDGLSRGAGGMDARAGAARLGDDAEQSRQRASDAGRAGERDGAAGGGGRRPTARRWRNGRASGCRSTGR